MKLLIEKEKESFSGVYLIGSSLFDEIYIGSAVSFYKRFHVHRSRLRANKHHSRKLQRLYNIHGAENLYFTPLLNCHVSELEQNENFLISTLCPALNTSNFYSNGMLGRHHSEETKQKIRQSNRGQKRGPATQEQLDNLAYYRNLPRNEKHRESIRKSKLGEKNPMYGKVPVNIRPVIQLDLNGQKVAEYDSLKLADNSTGVDYRNIQAVCTGKRKQSGGYRWAYKF